LELYYGEIEGYKYIGRRYGFGKLPMWSLAGKNPDLDEESEFERRDCWISLKDAFEGWDEEEMAEGAANC